MSITKKSFLKVLRRIAIFLSEKPSLYSKCPHIIHCFEFIYECNFDKNDKIECKNVLTFWGNTLTMALFKGFPVEEKQLKKIFKRVEAYAQMISSKKQ